MLRRYRKIKEDKRRKKRKKRNKSDTDHRHTTKGTANYGGAFVNPTLLSILSGPTSMLLPNINWDNRYIVSKINSHF